MLHSPCSSVTYLMFTNCDINVCLGFLLQLKNNFKMHQILQGNRPLLLVLAALEKVQCGAAGYVFNNYSNCTPGCVISMLADLKWKHLEQQRLCN